METSLGTSLFLESGRGYTYGGTCPHADNTPQQSPPSGLGHWASYSVCEVCNLQLSSSSQAEVHYNGRSHLRRVRQAGLPPPGTARGLTWAQPPGPGPDSLARGLTLAPGITSGPASLSSTSTHTVSLATGRGCGQAAGGGPSVVMQGSMELKQFVSFPVENTPPVGLFANFNTMDPVQKAVINHTFGVTMVPRRKQTITCNLCQLRFNSDSQAEAHYKGTRHAKKLKAQDKDKTKLSITRETKSSGSSPTGPAQKYTDLLSSLSFIPPVRTSVSSSSPTSSSRVRSEPHSSSPPSTTPASREPCSSKAASASPPTSSSSPSSCASCSPPAPQMAPPSGSEEERCRQLLYCSLCKVAVNSLSQLEAHNTGSKHKTMLDARSGSGPIKAFPRPGAHLKPCGQVQKGSGLQNQTFHCQICDVHVNSEVQLKQHISSRRHKDQVAGKPSKPKYSPYKQARPTAAAAPAAAPANKITLQKDSLPPAFLSSAFIPPSSLAGPAPSILPLSMSLHPHPGPALFPTPFLRPAPGPIRSGRGPLLFSPY